MWLLWREPNCYTFEDIEVSKTKFMSLYYFVNGQISLVLMIVVLLHSSLSSFLLLVLFYGNSFGYLVFFLMHEVDIRDKINAYPKTKVLKDDRMTEKNTCGRPKLVHQNP